MSAADVDQYLAALPDDQRAALEALRETIRAAAPGATETISYGMPTFKRDGRPLIYYSAWKKHCSIYGLSYAMIDRHSVELESYTVDKGTIRFTPERPLPAELVRTMVHERIGELQADAEGEMRTRA